LNIPADRLSDHLARGLAALYVVVGDEPLAAQEAADAIRAAARAAGHSERTVYTVLGATTGRAFSLPATISRCSPSAAWQKSAFPPASPASTAPRRWKPTPPSCPPTRSP